MSNEPKIIKTFDLSAVDPIKLKQVRLHRLRDMKHEYYVPTGVGEKFIEAVGSDRYFISLFSAANGIGKSCLGANMFAEFMFPSDNGWFDYKLFNDWPYPKRARIISDPTTLVSTIIPMLKEWLPRGHYTVDKKGKNYEYYWKTDTGWEFDLMSYDQDPKEFESATLGLVWLDEPPPESIYKATVARLRLGGTMYITATPLTGSAWIYDQILARKGKPGNNTFYIEADVESACKEHGVRGFLEHEHIEQMTSEYSEDEKQARIYGKFQHLVGLVYKQFSRRVHVIRPFDINMRDYAVTELLDPHPRNPDAVLWGAVDSDQTKFVVDELWKKVTSDGELARRIKKIADQYRIVARWADPSAFVEDQHTGQSLALKLSKYGLNYQPASKARVAANRRISDALDYQEKGGVIIQTPEVYIFDNCERTIWELEHWRWDEWAGKATDRHNSRETPVDKDDHFIENLGRWLFGEPSFVPYTRAGRSTAIGEISESADDPYSRGGGGASGEISDDEDDPY